MNKFTNLLFRSTETNNKKHDYIKDTARQQKTYREKAYIHSLPSVSWSNRSYESFSIHGYMKNPIIHRCISIIAQGAASVAINLYEKTNDNIRARIYSHPLLELLSNPNTIDSKFTFMEKIYSYKLLSGNVFIQTVANVEGSIKGLNLLRPDRMSLIVGSNGAVTAYKYKTGNKEKIFYIEVATGTSEILHIKNFHPLDDFYGASYIESASGAMDQYNEAIKWNQSILQNGARPSGALIVKSEANGGYLPDEQFERLKTQLDNEFSGYDNAGKPLLLEGGLDWKELSMTHKDMDFLNMKHSTARDIALGIGVPPQLLGIPGDNTYSNLTESRLALWEQTILPLMTDIIDSLNRWLTVMFGKDLYLEYDIESISALSIRRDELWDRVSKAEFLTNEEKKQAIGM